MNCLAGIVASTSAITSTNLSAGHPLLPNVALQHSNFIATVRAELAIVGTSYKMLRASFTAGVEPAESMWQREKL